MPEQNRDDELEALKQRLAQLESRLPHPASGKSDYERASEPLNLPAWVAPLVTLLAVGFGYLGVGVPLHYYPYLFTLLTLLLLYQRGWLEKPVSGWPVAQALLNFALVALFYRLIIGGGVRYPLDWLKTPTLQKQPVPDDASWLDKVTPDYEIVWQQLPASQWTVDLTQLQTLLLLAVIFGAVARFQGFASLAAVALLVASAPAFLAYQWDWVILFLTTGGTALYLQCAARPR